MSARRTRRLLWLACASAGALAFLPQLVHAQPLARSAPARRDSPVRDAPRAASAAAATPAPAASDPWLGQDKFKHVGMSFAATSFVFAGASSVVEPADALRAAVGAAVVAGIGKEVLDRRDGGMFSLRDLVADAVGIAAAVLILCEVR